MKCLSRNKVPFYYALYEGKEMITDEYGNYTTEYGINYSNPKKFEANISASNGSTETTLFGTNVDYDKVIVYVKADSPKIDEYSVLWVDVKPEIKDDGTTDTPHDYIVKKVANSLNFVSLAISKVKISE